ncbi:MAG: hypothetical protein KJO42_01870, partial [Silicimonas sp.]|nr:hypothetical protein [Silicimonas sp.]
IGFFGCRIFGDSLMRRGGFGGLLGGCLFARGRIGFGRLCARFAGFCCGHDTFQREEGRDEYFHTTLKKLVNGLNVPR